jgi:rRNA maturation RNase YbeY
LAKKINKKNRQKDYVPNILSFEISKKSGEIFICPEKAKTDCQNFGMGYKKFVVFLLIHGLLHLKGMKEPTSFPMMIYLHNQKVENYEDASELPDNEKDRKIDSFVKWIETKIDNDGESNKGTLSQKGGIFINTEDSGAFEHFLRNSKISMLLSGAFGITFKAELQKGATTTYRYLSQENFNQPVTCLLIKLCCLFNKENGE